MIEVHTDLPTCPDVSGPVRVHFVILDLNKLYLTIRSTLTMMEQAYDWDNLTPTTLS